MHHKRCFVPAVSEEAAANAELLRYLAKVLELKKSEVSLDKVSSHIRHLWCTEMFSAHYKECY